MHFIYRVSRAINTTLEQSGLFGIITQSIFDEFEHSDRISIVGLHDCAQPRDR